MFKTNKLKYLYHQCSVTYRETAGMMFKGIYDDEKQERWFFLSNNCALDGAKPHKWNSDELKKQTSYTYSYAVAIVGEETCYHEFSIHYPHNIPRSAFEELREGDIVKLVNPTSRDFKFGGIGIIQNKYGVAGIAPADWRAKVEYVASDYIRVVFLDIQDSGFYKFARYELELVTRTFTVSDVKSWSTSSNGTANVIIGHTHVAPGAYTHSFIATPSGHVETLNDDMPLFKRVVVKPNKVPDLE